MMHKPEDTDPAAPWNFCGHVHQHYKVKRLNKDSLIVNLSVGNQYKGSSYQVITPNDLEGFII